MARIIEKRLLGAAMKPFKGPDPKPIKKPKKGVKHPLKQMTLNYGCPSIIKNEDGEYVKLHPQVKAYLDVVGRMPPEPFPEGTLAHEQWKYRKGLGRSASQVARPDAKPTPKRKLSRRRAA